VPTEPGARSRWRQLALLGAACGPLLLALSSTECLWTDISEIAERSLISVSLSELGTAFKNGVAGHY
jgi:hypothetical protein